MTNESIQSFVETIRDEAHTLLSGLPSDLSSDFARLEAISKAANSAMEVLTNSVANPEQTEQTGQTAAEASAGLKAGERKLDLKGDGIEMAEKWDENAIKSDKAE